MSTVTVYLVQMCLQSATSIDHSYGHQTIRPTHRSTRPTSTKGHRHIVAQPLGVFRYKRRRISDSFWTQHIQHVLAWDSAIPWVRSIHPQNALTVLFPNMEVKCQRNGLSTNQIAETEAMSCRVISDMAGIFRSVGGQSPSVTGGV